MALPIPMHACTSLGGHRSDTHIARSCVQHALSLPPSILSPTPSILSPLPPPSHQGLPWPQFVARQAICGCGTLQQVPPAILQLLQASQGLSPGPRPPQEPPCTITGPWTPPTTLAATTPIAGAVASTT